MNNGNPHDLSIERPKVMRCACSSLFQDALYGKGMRLHNPRKNGPNRDGKWSWNCTVCGPDSKTQKLRNYASKFGDPKYGPVQLYGCK